MIIGFPPYIPITMRAGFTMDLRRHRNSTELHQDIFKNFSFHYKKKTLGFGNNDAGHLSFTHVKV